MDSKKAIKKTGAKKGMSFFQIIFTGILIFLGASVILALIFALISLKLGDPLTLALPFGVVCLIISAFVSCLWTAKKNSDSVDGLKVSLYTMCANLLVVIIASLISSSYDNVWIQTLFPIAAVILSGAAGMYTGLHSRSGTKKKLKKLKHMK